MTGHGSEPAAGPAAPAVERFLELIERARPDDAIDLALDRVHQGESVTHIVRDLLAPAQLLVGQRWHVGTYTVAQEHVASGVVEDVLGLLTTHARHPGAEHTVALVCAEGEWHTTPARMAALCLRDAGWRVQFLGGSLPPDHLVASLGHVAPRAVAISCTLPLALVSVPHLVDACRHHQLPTLAGGSGFGPDGLRAERLGVDGHALGLTAAGRILTGWLDRPPPPPDGSSATVVDEERAILERDRGEIVAATYGLIEERIPTVATYDVRRQQHTRRDLDYITRYLEITLLVDDQRVFDDFATWLHDLLSSRGLPTSVLPTSLWAVADVLPAELVRARAVIERGLAALGAEATPQRGTISER